MGLIKKFARAARDYTVNAGDIFFTGLATTGFAMSAAPQEMNQVQKGLSQRMQARKAARRAAAQ